MLFRSPGNYVVKGTTPLPPPGAGGKHIGLTNIEPRLEEYQKLGIDKQLLLSQFSAIYFNYTLEPGLAIQMAHSHNIAIHNLLKKYPNSVYAVAVQPKVAVKDKPESLQQYVKIKEIPLVTKQTSVQEERQLQSKS